MKKILLLIAVIFISICFLYANDLNTVDYNFRTFAVYKSPISHQTIQIEGTDHGWEAWTIEQFEKKLKEHGFIKIKGAESPDEYHLFGPSIGRILISFGRHPASLNGFGINFKDWETGDGKWYLQPVFLEKLDSIVRELR